jgi:arylformamidase
LSEPVFLHYHQERLDALLDARRNVPDFLTFTDRFTERSQRTVATTPCVIDVRYGAHPRERLDVFLPDGASPSNPVPVNIFFHGGYWRSSEKERYSFVADTFVPHGAACVVVEYALIPDVDMDELIRQCRAAVAFVHANGASWGIDVERLFVSGHSAGGQIVGLLMAAGWHEAFGLPTDVVKGGCGISGLYDMVAIQRSYLNATLALDDASTLRNSPVELAPATGAPLIAAVGALEGEEFLRQNALPARRWSAIDVAELVLDGLQHYSAVESLGDPASPLGRAVLDQMGLAPR